MSSPVGFSSAWPAQEEVTNVWYGFGHSFINYTIGTRTQMGRLDSLFRSALRLEQGNWSNYAQPGARLAADSMWNNGWLPLFFETQSRGNTATWPYVSEGGGLLLVQGINDLGNLGHTTQNLTAYQHTLRTCISRWRASAVRLNTHSSLAYGAGFVSTTGQEERSSTGTLRRSTATGGTNTITLTIPSDYKGEPLVLCFIGRAGTVGGTVTFTGATSGTLSTSNIMPSASGFYVPVIKRITNLTSANAGQTITVTTTQIDASGDVLFDSYWLESLTPQPVIVTNINRGTATMYSNYYTSTWTGTEASKDADVVLWNAGIASVVAEFDPMCQVADIDRALNKDPDMFAGGSDNQLHPNEWGAARCVDAIVDAVHALKPVPSRAAKYGTTSFYNPSAPAAGANRLPMGTISSWYGAQCKQLSGTGLTWTSQNQWWVPLMITDPDVRFDMVAVELFGTAPTTGAQVRIGYYLENSRVRGAPGRYVVEWTGSGLAMGTTTGWKTASIGWEPDPGLYFLSLKITATATTNPTMRAMDGPCPHMPTFMGTGANPTAGTTQPVAWLATSQGTSSFGTRAPSSIAATATAPLIALRRSAAA